MSKVYIVIILHALLFCGIVIANDHMYVLPEADYNEVPPSEPCYSGVINKTNSGFIILGNKSKSEKKLNTKVNITASTQIFTVYGGYVSADELKSGQKVRVWYKGKSCSQPDTPLEAARVQIASKNTEDDWPKTEK